MTTRNASRTAMPRWSRLVLGCAVAAFALGSTACSSGGKRGPDEFRVVTKAPLQLPPEYNLRPPEPGKPTLADITPGALASTAYFGGITPAGSDAEQFMLAKAGAATATPAVRALLDLEAAGLIRKEKTFANRILFWRGGADIVDGENPGQVVDAEEAARRQASVNAATGGDQVVMRRNVGPKLPGL